MSEPMSSGEIEDVLSSIRRLVSEDLRPVAAYAASPKPKALPSAGKLLLTPALRVVSNTSAPVETDRLGDHPAASAVAAEDWLPEAAADSADEVLEPVDAESPDGWEQADLPRVVSEIGAAVAQSEEEWEPEVGEAPMASLSWSAPEWVEEAELVEAPVDAISAKALADAAEEEAVAEIMARAAQAEDAEPQSPDDDLFAESEGGYFDEAVLRDLVRDLIREELSGSLGERITRNVRKLVRAEINRAMTARNFE